MAEENKKDAQTTEPATEEKAAASKTAKAKKSGETEKVKKKLEQVTEELEKTKDMLLRTAAEFDNYKKRTEREKGDISLFIKAATVKELLPVADNIARAALCEKGSDDYLKGLELITKQLCETLEKLGLTEIEALGQPFDPTLHEAVMHVEDENLGENVVAEVLQTGYKIGDTVIRPSMVKVAN